MVTVSDARVVNSYSQISAGNSSSAALSGGATFTGAWQLVDTSPSLLVAVKSDQDGTLSIDFSPDGTNVDSTITYPYVQGEINPPHRLVITRLYFRVRYVNGAAAQSFFRLQVRLGDYSALTSSLNSTISKQADTMLTRNIDAEISIAQGLFEGYSIVNKFGLNPDVDTATVPEDLWGNGGTYTGWATAAETLQVFSSAAADASAGTGLRTVRITGLDANYNVITETVTLNGLTPVLTTQLFLRAHTMTGLTAGSGAVNAGTITVRQSSTTANIMLFMAVGRNQTNESVYTVPAGYTAYMRTIHCACGTASTTSIEGNIWVRPFGGIFRSRRPFFLSNSFRLYDEVYGGLTFTEKSDLTLRITSVSANNTPINGGYDLILVKN